MELGNLLFGNSRGNFPINRIQIEDAFWKYFDDVCDAHGYFKNSNTESGGYENDIFLIRPYYWGEDEKLMEEPNFVYKPEGIEIDWYKYPFRDAYSNIELTKEKADEIFRRSRESVEI